jgi:hypothetical protein
MESKKFSKIFNKETLLIYFSVLIFLTHFIRINFGINLINIIFIPFLVVYTSHYFGKRKEYDFYTVTTTILLILILIINFMYFIK